MEALEEDSCKVRAVVEETERRCGEGFWSNSNEEDEEDEVDEADEEVPLVA